MYVLDFTSCYEGCSEMLRTTFNFQGADVGVSCGQAQNVPCGQAQNAPPCPYMAEVRPPGAHREVELKTPP